MSFLPRLCCLLLCWPALTLHAQLEADIRAVQFAISLRYGETIGGGPNFELPQTGERQLSSRTFEQELELRFSKSWSGLLSIGFSNSKSWRTPEPGSTPFVEDPEFITHPFTSELDGIMLQLGGQYSYRIGNGDLGIAATGGFVWNAYEREYDLIREDNGTYLAGGTAIDRTKWTTSFIGVVRVQYTYWFSRQLAFSIGGQYLVPSYLSGGVETPGGVRYELDEQQSAILAVPFDVNYDITSQTPDPSVKRNRLNWFIGFTTRI